MKTPESLERLIAVMWEHLRILWIQIGQLFGRMVDVEVKVSKMSEAGNIVTSLKETLGEHLASLHAQTINDVQGIIARSYERVLVELQQIRTEFESVNNLRDEVALLRHEVDSLRAEVRAELQRARGE